MATIEQLKQQIDLHDLADKLGLERPGGRGNYKSPRHDDRTPSLQVFADGKGFKDWSCEGEEHSTGSCIDLVIWCNRADDVRAAVKALHELYAIPLEPPAGPKPREKMSTPEYIASKCFDDTTRAREYLSGRAISEEVIDRAVKAQMVGFNDWHSSKNAPGTIGYGGPAVAFIVRTLNPGHVAAVDMRYLDPDLNGGVKTQTQGEKLGVPWTSNVQRLKRADTLYFVESAINALSIESCKLRSTAALAIRGLSNAGDMDLRFAQGKRVVICMDADEPQKDDRRPGPEAAWLLHERLTSLNVAAHLVDQLEWYEQGLNDVNDVLHAQGPIETAVMLQKLEQCPIAGMIGGKRHYPGRSRVFLPAHDLAQYWKYRCKEDFTTLIKIKQNEDGGELEEASDLCDFRIAGMSRITVTSANAALFGGEDSAPQKKTVVTAQVPGEKTLQRHVFDEGKLHKIDKWDDFGYIYNKSAFMRLVAILKRTSSIGERVTTNIVGISWQEGKPVINEGPDCYFDDPHSQCPYSFLKFPTGPRDDARRVLLAYHATMKDCAALTIVAWAMGAHLKAWLRFWPHLVLQAKKASGKTTLLNSLANSFAMDIRGGQALNTEWRLLTAVSHSVHPIMWEELSTRSKLVISQAVKLLQESYNATMNPRGKPVVNYLVCAPVLIAGEDVPVDSLIGKTVRSDIVDKKGDLVPATLPRFPVLDWLKFLTGLSRERVATLFADALDYARKNCRANLKTKSDTGASRIVENYAALMTAWRLLEEFSGLPKDQLPFIAQCITEMNTHVEETEADRQPWVWILQTIFGEISSGNYRFPYKIMMYNTPDYSTPVLIIRCTHIIQHLSTSMTLRALYDDMPIKSDRALKKLLIDAEVVCKDRVDVRVKGNRECHMMALNLDRLGRYALHVSWPEDDELEHLTDE